jgi:hypothetical protein
MLLPLWQGLSLCTDYSKGLKVKFSGVTCNAQTTIMQLGIEHLDGYNYCLAILWTSCIQFPLQTMLRRDKGDLTRAESTYQLAISSWTHVQVAAKMTKTSSTHSDDILLVFADA